MLTTNFKKEVKTENIVPLPIHMLYIYPFVIILEVVIAIIYTEFDLTRKFIYNGFHT